MQGEQTGTAVPAPFGLYASTPKKCLVKDKYQAKSWYNHYQPSDRHPVRFDLPLRLYMQMQEAPSENPAGGNIFKQALKIHVQHKV